MREPVKDPARLEHMSDAIARILDFVKGKSKEDLQNDSVLYYAVVKNIEIIGEAANMLTTEFHDAHPETPWKMVKGMRNYIVHEYFQIDDIVVWDVVTNNLKPLRNQLEIYLENTDWTALAAEESKQDED